MTELKVMDIGNIIDRTFKMILSKNSLRLILFYILLNIFFVFILAWLVFYSFGFDINNFNFDFNQSSFLSKLPVFIPVVFIVIILMIFISIVYNSMTTDLYSNIFINKEWTIKESFNMSIKKAGTFIFYYFLLFIFGLILSLVYIGISILFGLLATVSPLFIIPLFLFVFALYIVIFAGFIFITLSLPAIVIDNLTAMKSLIRSFKLVKHNFWRILGSNLLLSIIISFVTYILLFIIIIIVILILLLLKIDLTNSSVIAAIFIISYMALLLLILIIYQCMQSAFNVLIFYNQKIKNEGFGVQMLAESMIDDNQIPDEKQEKNIDKK